MGRKPQFPPTLLHAKSSGQAKVRLRENGQVRDIYLGPWGSDEANQAYARLVAELAANGGQVPAPKVTANAGLTVDEVLARWWVYADVHYRRPDGTPKQELTSFTYALRPLAHLYGSKPAAEFGTLGLKAVRGLMASGYEHPEFGTQRPLARRNLNRMIVRIRTFFRWAESEQLVPAGTYQTLLTVAGLEEGTRGVRDKAPVLPVSESDLLATLEQLGTIPRALAEVQLLTAARPGEVIRLRACDLLRQDRVQLAPGFVLETQGKVWVFLPQGHKTRHLGHRRVILFGPQAQEVLRPFLEGRAPDAYLFSPREASEAYMRAHGRRVHHGKSRQPGEHYTLWSYDKAIAKAAKRAGVPHWHPHQLRHNAATRLRQQFGIEVARIILGHRHVSMTENYAQQDLTIAIDAMKKAG